MVPGRDKGDPQQKGKHLKMSTIPVALIYCIAYHTQTSLEIVLMMWYYRLDNFFEE